MFAASVVVTVKANEGGDAEYSVKENAETCAVLILGMGREVPGPQKGAGAGVGV